MPKAAHSDEILSRIHWFQTYWPSHVLHKAIVFHDQHFVMRKAANNDEI